MKIVPLNTGLPPTRVVSVASGKGGVGKTSVTVNLAFALAREGNTVCILDADLGLSNVDILLGVEPEKTLEDVLFEGLPMREAIVPVGPGVDLLSGASGVPRLAELDRESRRALVDQFQALDTYDYLLVDNSPGITAQIISICLSSRDILLVVTPDATSITDAYALIKILAGNGLWWTPLILVNRARNERQARLIFEKIRATAGKHLNIGCRYLGFVPEDGAVSRAGASRKPLMEQAPGAPAARALKAAALALDAVESVRGRDVAPMHFLDGSIMRLKQEATRTETVAAAAKRFSERRQAEATAPPADVLDRLWGLLDRLERPTSHGERDRILRAMRRELAALRGALAPARTRRTNGQAEATPQPQGNGKALLVCPPSPMRDVLSEVLASTGLSTVAAHPRGGDGPDFSDYSLGLICWDAPATELEHLVSRSGDTPVVMLRGYRRSPEQEPDLTGRRVTVLHKPFKVADLAGAIRKAVQG